MPEKSPQFQAFEASNLYKGDFYNYYVGSGESLGYMTFWRRLQITAAKNPEFFPMKKRKTFTVKKRGKIIRRPSTKSESFSNKILSRKQMELYIEEWGAPKGWS